MENYKYRSWYNTETHVIPSNEEVVELKFKPVTKQNMLTALRGLKDSKSPGPDRIPAKILRDAAELICDPLIDNF